MSFFSGVDYFIQRERMPSPEEITTLGAGASLPLHLSLSQPTSSPKEKPEDTSDTGLTSVIMWTRHPVSPGMAVDSTASLLNDRQTNSIASLSRNGTSECGSQGPSEADFGNSALDQSHSSAFSALNSNKLSRTSKANTTSCLSASFSRGEPLPSQGGPNATPSQFVDADDAARVMAREVTSKTASARSSPSPEKVTNTLSHVSRAGPSPTVTPPLTEAVQDATAATIPSKGGVSQQSRRAEKAARKAERALRRQRKEARRLAREKQLQLQQKQEVVTEQTLCVPPKRSTTAFLSPSVNSKSPPVNAEVFPSVPPGVNSSTSAAAACTSTDRAPPKDRQVATREKDMSSAVGNSPNSSVTTHPQSGGTGTASVLKSTTGGTDTSGDSLNYPKEAHRRMKKVKTSAERATKAERRRLKEQKPIQKEPQESLPVTLVVRTANNPKTPPEEASNLHPHDAVSLTEMSSERQMPLQYASTVSPEALRQVIHHATSLRCSSTTTTQPCEPDLPRPDIENIARGMQVSVQLAPTDCRSPSQIPVGCVLQDSVFAAESPTNRGWHPKSHHSRSSSLLRESCNISSEASQPGPQGFPIRASALSGEQQQSQSPHSRGSSQEPSEHTESTGKPLCPSGVAGSAAAAVQKLKRRQHLPLDQRTVSKACGDSLDPSCIGGGSAGDRRDEDDASRDSGSDSYVYSVSSTSRSQSAYRECSSDRSSDSDYSCSTGSSDGGPLRCVRLDLKEGMTVPPTLLPFTDLHYRMVNRTLLQPYAEAAVIHEWNTKEGCWGRVDTLVVLHPQPFSHGNMRASYHMVDLQRLNCKLVAKRYLKTSVEDEQYYDDVSMHSIAGHWARLFNAQRPPKNVKFVPAAVLELRERKPPLILAMEPQLDGQFRKYNNNCGYVPRNARWTPQAFSHFTYHASKQQLLIVDIQGVGDIYTDPQLLSPDGKGYGRGNLGVKGIRRFLQSHRCNAVCKALNLPQLQSSPQHSPHTMTSGIHVRLNASNAQLQVERLPPKVHSRSLEHLKTAAPQPGGYPQVVPSHSFGAVLPPSLADQQAPTTHARPPNALQTRQHRGPVRSVLSSFHWSGANGVVTAPSSEPNYLYHIRQAISRPQSSYFMTNGSNGLAAVDSATAVPSVNLATSSHESGGECSGNHTPLVPPHRPARPPPQSLTVPRLSALEVRPPAFRRWK